MNKLDLVAAGDTPQIGAAASVAIDIDDLSDVVGGATFDVLPLTQATDPLKDILGPLSVNPINCISGKPTCMCPSKFA